MKTPVFQLSREKHLKNPESGAGRHRLSLLQMKPSLLLKSLLLRRRLLLPLLLLPQKRRRRCVLMESSVGLPLPENAEGGVWPD